MLRTAYFAAGYFRAGTLHGPSAAPVAVVLEAAPGVVVSPGTPALLRHTSRLVAASGSVALVGGPLLLSRVWRLLAFAETLTLSGTAATLAVRVIVRLTAEPGTALVQAPAVQWWWSRLMKRRVVSPTEVVIVAPDGTPLARYYLRPLPHLRTYHVRLAQEPVVPASTSRPASQLRTYAVRRRKESLYAI